jgi:hypothetical protein
MRVLVSILSCFGFASSSVLAQDSFPEFKVHGLIDVRAFEASDELSWFDRGLSKVRYGRNGDGKKPHFDLAEASLVGEASFSWSLSAMAHVKFDSEQKNAVDLVEAFIRYNPVSTSPWRVRAKAGMFFPPISLEHSDIAWTSPYSLTPSAINSWVGEEVKSTGVEVTLEHKGEDNIFSLTGSAFMLNDPTGTLLAWRGWALHDVKTTAFGRFSLPTITSLDTIFPDRQAPWVEPHHEIDDRIGYYVSAKWEMLDVITLTALYYDNRGDPRGQNEHQYSWGTDFYNIGATGYLPGDIEFLAQYMGGQTLMGPVIGDYNVVTVNFNSHYIMLSKQFGEQQISVRYDHFETEDLSFITEDNNNEKGHAWMASVSRTFMDKHRVMFEVQLVDSDRANRADLGIPTRAKEKLFQLSYRFAF